MTYVTGMVCSVPNAEKDKFIQMARSSAPVFRRHGALEVVDCWGTDVPEGKLTSFPMAVKCKDDETVVFSWITWPDKATSDAGMQAAMADPAMAGQMQDMPIDGKRMIFGGFEMI